MKKNIIFFFLILMFSFFGGYFNALRTHQSFFSNPPSSEEEKFIFARKNLRKEIPLLKFDAVEKVYQNNSKIFIDARHTEEYIKGHIEDAISLPLVEIEKQLPEFLQKYNPQTPFLIYCGGLDCSASIDLANKFYETGYLNLEVYAGGWQEWQKLHQK